MSPYFAQQVINAVGVSAIYGLMTVSYVLMHAVTRRINLAFGALAVWCGYVAIDVTMALMLSFPGQTLAPLAAGLAFGILHTALTGSLIERAIIRPLVPVGSFAMLVATLGLAITLEEIIRLTHDSRDVWLIPVFNQPWVIGGTEAFPVSVTPVLLFTIAAAILLSLGLMLFIDRHPFGRLWRAVAEDRDMAELTGIATGRVFQMTFLLASAYAASGGALLALNYGGVSFYAGTVMGLKTLFVAVIGGLNSIGGAFAGALCLGVLETFWSAYLGSAYRDAAAFVLLTGLLILFPQGLFAGPVRRDHAP